MYALNAAQVALHKIVTVTFLVNPTMFYKAAIFFSSNHLMYLHSVVISLCEFMVEPSQSQGIHRKQ